MFHRPTEILKLPFFIGTISVAELVDGYAAAGVPAVHYVVICSPGVTRFRPSLNNKNL